MKSPVGEKSIKLRPRAKAISAMTDRSGYMGYLQVKMRGRASVDQVANCQVSGDLKMAKVKSAPSARARARASFSRLTSRGVMSSRVRGRSGNFGGSEGQAAIAVLR